MNKAGSYACLPLERVVFGRPAAEAALEEMARVGASRVFIVASKSLARNTPVVSTIAQVLGSNYVGLFDGCVQHSPRASVIEAARAVRAAAPDLILTIGGGTAIDTVKVLQICLAHRVETTEGLDGLHVSVGADGRRQVPEIRPSPVRQVVVPTTLSGAEFSNLAGITDERIRQKHSFIGPDVGARSIILDPQMTVHTPEWLWLSTGIRGVDHAVETLCSTDAHPYCDGLALHALRLFAEALPRPDDLAARLTCQQASWLAGSSINRVNYGASHGIGHTLGAFADVPHGHTSCVMLPHVMRYNMRATAAKQRLIAEALGQADIPAADAIAGLIERLKQPTTLRAVGVKREQLPKIAEAAMHNIWVRTNPQPIHSPDDVMQLLEAAW
jgi:maleylacetate reductase